MNEHSGLTKQLYETGVGSLRAGFFFDCIAVRVTHVTLAENVRDRLSH